MLVSSANDSPSDLSFLMYTLYPVMIPFWCSIGTSPHETTMVEEFVLFAVMFDGPAPGTKIKRIMDGKFKGEQWLHSSLCVYSNKRHGVYSK